MSQELLKILAIETPTNCRPESTGGNCLTKLPEVSADEEQLKRGLTIVFGTIAAIAIVTILLAAINIASGGNDPDKIARAKRSIIYSLIGLAIAISAEIIVLTLIGRL
jgi:hypothetical protein